MSAFNVMDQSFENLVSYYFSELMRVIESGFFPSSVRAQQRKNLKEWGIVWYSFQTRRYVLTDEAIRVFYRVRERSE